MSASDKSLRRLVKSNFNRPEITYQDTLQNKSAMAEKLKNYVRVEDIEDVQINTHVRYVTIDKDNKQVFRLGGLLTKIHPKYVTLSNGTYKWSVQRYHYEDNNNEPIFETIFFKITTKDEQLLSVINKKDIKIKELEERLRKLER
tara:strand:+ start:986 stop:1420 length:435 start_codon:yes stop_codon:yes gene_type:complete